MPKANPATLAKKPVTAAKNPTYNKAADILCLAMLEMQAGNTETALRLSFAALQDSSMQTLAAALEHMNNVSEENLAGEAEAETPAEEVEAAAEGDEDIVSRVIRGLDAEAEAATAEDDEEAPADDEEVEEEAPAEDEEDDLADDATDEDEEGEYPLEEASIEDEEVVTAGAAPPRVPMTREERALANKLSLEGTVEARQTGLRVLTGAK